ncbi:16S rRNA (cytidine(1402)-2'-O)-methyltransferase [Mycoplasma feriruminatoris]|uniref:16S rRNA (cytidine(1402)-2'-O)-methyltransferase n=1 Tax=Mycoplasma feriruminatoris TaxID=1179777 RepID=UPI00241E96E7|nr:16S rRNA (cytidine(1402)-2'-O)-methyltransferase [Mycoplasma feriruminatoris]WFQ95927.1 16S rRNA (cytidine(1402)-2'-O)-methyltransferase [Mycoplasma feriruminatoris]
MIIQKTYKNNKPTVYLVTTPIGNLEDISFRAINILKQVDVICCEDTRTSKVLLDKYQIKNNLLSLHKFNENLRVDQIINLLNENKNIAIISDAGVPIISDPASYIINQLKELDINCNITAISAGSAYTHALISSGFLIDSHYFYGFLKNKNKISKQNELAELINKYANDSIICLYESVHRLKDTINCLNEILNQNHKIVISKELTKINEEIIYGTINEVNQYINSEEFVLKGEFVIVIDKKTTNLVNKYSDIELMNLIDIEIKSGYKLKQACEIISLKTQIPKNILYKKYISKKNF